MKPRLLLLSAVLSLAPTLLHGQFDFKIADRKVQVHSFASQGFLYSNQNNYLTMKTSDGSVAMTDGGANISISLTDRFRVGAQAYARNVGRLGNGQVQLDWAYGDYRFARWFGVRAGKIKTVLGLYNDTQDLESLHTWALLPQSAYPLDLRSSTIAHTGGDIYGDIPLGKNGSLAYTAYGGTRPTDRRGDKEYVLADFGVIPTKAISGRMAGGDLRWNSRLPGLILGASYSNIDYSGSALMSRRLPLDLHTTTDSINAFYADYMRGPLHLSSEYRKNWEVVAFKSIVPVPDVQADQRSWYIAGAYRLHKRLELGTYHSRFTYDPKQMSRASTGSFELVKSHIYDQAVTARFDITKFWSIKVEGHFIDGVGTQTSSHGFYMTDNPTGLKDTTRLLVIRTGWSF